MPYRIVPIVTDSICHIFNRSIAKEPIFQNLRDKQRFYNLIDFYRYEKPSSRFSYWNNLSMYAKDNFIGQLRLTHPLHVDILAYSIMPNHYHLMLRQRIDGGISNFISRIQDAYAKYYDLKNKRTGSLFQSAFRCSPMESEEQIYHVVRYIHLNQLTAHILENPEDLSIYPWTSFYYYVNKDKNSFIETETILSNFKSIESFTDFTISQVSYQRELAYASKVLLDHDDL